MKVEYPYKVNYNGKEYNVVFYYDSKYDRRRQTIAAIREDKKIIIQADAQCSKHDQWSKKLGRLIAYGRLVKRIEDESKVIKNDSN